VFHQEKERSVLVVAEDLVSGRSLLTFSEVLKLFDDDVSIILSVGNKPRNENGANIV